MWCAWGAAPPGMQQGEGQTMMYQRPTVPPGDLGILWVILISVSFIVSLVAIVFLPIYISISAHQTRDELMHKLNKISHLVITPPEGALLQPIDSRTITATNDGTTLVVADVCIVQPNPPTTPVGPDICLTPALNLLRQDTIRLDALSPRVDGNTADIRNLQNQVDTFPPQFTQINGQITILEGQTQQNTNDIANLTAVVRRDELNDPQQYWEVLNIGCGLSACGPPVIVPTRVSPNSTVDLTRYEVDLTLSPVIVYRIPGTTNIVLLSTLVQTFLNISAVTTTIQTEFDALNVTVNAALAFLPTTQSVDAGIDMTVSNPGQPNPITQIQLTNPPNNVLSVLSANLVITTPLRTAPAIHATGLFSFSAATAGGPAFGMQQVTSIFSLTYAELPPTLYHITVPCTATVPRGFYGTVNAMLSAQPNSTTTPIFVNTVSVLAEIEFGQSPNFPAVAVTVNVTLRAAPVYNFVTNAQVQPFLAVTPDSPLVIACPFSMTKTPPPVSANWVTE